MRPRFVYRLSEEAIAHASTRGCLTIQQRDPLLDDRDRSVFLEPHELRKLRAALDDYLAEDDSDTAATAQTRSE